jgi:IS605 OrfB family transposase
MPSLFSKLAASSSRSDDVQYITLTISVPHLSKRKHKILENYQKAFTKCVTFFLDKSKELNTSSPYKLHMMCNAEAREKFDLGSAAIQSARDKAVSMQRIFWSRVRHRKHTTRPETAGLVPIVLRQDAYVWGRTHRGNRVIRFLIEAGRKKYLVVPVSPRPYSLKYLDADFKSGPAELYRKPDGRWCLSVSLKIPVRYNEFSSVTGVDLGVRHPAVTSGGKFFRSGILSGIFRGLTSGKLHSRAERRKNMRRADNVNHHISRNLVKLAASQGAAIALENLTGLKERLLGRGGHDRSLPPQVVWRWPYRRLAAMIIYKARLAGVKAVTVDPGGTSITCAACGWRSTKNRTSPEFFSCVSCGHTVNADLNAARNIAARGAAVLGLGEKSRAAAAKPSTEDKTNEPRAEESQV